MSHSPRDQVGSNPGYHAVWSNLMFLLVTNFKLIPFFIPSLVCLWFFTMVGGLIFLTGALVLLIPAGPAVTAMYDMAYQLARDVPPYERRGFFASYRANFKQGCAIMAMLLPFLAVLLLLMLTAVEKPVWVTLCLMLGIFLVAAFAILAFSQAALVPLRLKEIANNALMLIPLTTWRIAAAALAQIGFVFMFYNFFETMVLLYLFLGPAVVITWSGNLLWPKLEQLLLEH